MSLPLAGIRVLDLSRLLPGPFCSLLLGDLGADVVKIEDPQGGDYIRWMPPHAKEVGVTFHALNRNKKSVTLNLKTEEAREIFRKLAARADVVLESFRPGVMERLGIGYERLREGNPGLVYCAISGYGQDGPYRDKAGHDLNYISLAGVLGVTGPPGETPTLPGVQIGDIGGGGLPATVGILAALLGRAKSGKGQFVDVSMTEGAFAFLTAILSRWMADDRPGRGLDRLAGGTACYGVYPTRDGKFMSLAALEPKFWETFVKTVGREDLLGEAFAEGEELAALRSTLQALFRTKTRDEWVALFRGKDVCCEPVLEPDEVLSDPQMRHRRMVFETRHPREGKVFQFRATPRMGELPDPPLGPAPLMGEHTEEILKEVGYTPADIAKFREGKVI